MKILITGNAGLIGANLSNFLIKKRHKVIGIDDLSGGNKSYIHQKIEFFHGDITTKRTIDFIFKKYRPDIVVHTAAQPAPGIAPYVRYLTYNTNVVGTMNLINASVKHNIKKFIFFSSMDVYGTNKSPFTENMMPKPTNSYGISKYCAEMDLKCAHDEFGMDYCILRPHQIFGKYQNLNDPYRNVICIFIRNILYGNGDINVYGDGLQKRAFSDVQYILKPIENIINSGSKNKIYNLGADKPTTILEVAKLAQKIAKKFGYKKTQIKHLSPRKEEKYMWCNHKMAKRDLNFEDKTDLEKLITILFQFAIKEPRGDIKKIKLELVKGIPEYWNI